MKRLRTKARILLGNKRGMEMVQVAILVASIYYYYIINSCNS